jgi:hypothetical protein
VRQQPVEPMTKLRARSMFDLDHRRQKFPKQNPKRAAQLFHHLSHPRGSAAVFRFIKIDLCLACTKSIPILIENRPKREEES